MLLALTTRVCGLGRDLCAVQSGPILRQVKSCLGFGLPWHFPQTTFHLQQICRIAATIDHHTQSQPRGGQTQGNVMKLVRSIPALILAFGLAACVQPEAASRNLTATMTGATSSAAVTAPLVQAGGKVVMHAQYDVQAVNVTVPRSLRTSEANTFHPNVELVWRGEPMGDRHAQVLAIFNEAMTAGTAPMHSGPQVVVDIEVVRFHCLTEKTRFTVGGIHNMTFMMTVRDAATGAVIQAPRLVVADVKAAGGARAIAEDRAGRTQRVVVVERLTEVIRRELSAPVAVMPQDQPVSRFDGSPIALTSTIIQ